MTLHRKIVVLVRIHDFKNAEHPPSIGEAAVSQSEIGSRKTRVLIDFVKQIDVERARATKQLLYLIAGGEEKFGKIGAVLANDAGDWRTLFILSPR